MIFTSIRILIACKRFGQKLLKIQKDSGSTSETLFLRPTNFEILADVTRTAKLTSSKILEISFSLKYNFHTIKSKAILSKVQKNLQINVTGVTHKI